MRKFLAIATFVVGVSAAATPSSAAERLWSIDQIDGRANAPITIIEYSSPSCSHCADFHKNTYPQLKKDWIDTGKVRVVYRSAPLDRGDVVASVLTICAAKKSIDLREPYFARTADLAKLSGEPNLKEKSALIVDIATGAGMSPQDLNKCLSDRAVLDKLMERYRDGIKQYQIKGTPTFIVNGKSVPGNIRYSDLDTLLKLEMK